MNIKVLFLLRTCVIACKHAVSPSWDQPECLRDHLFQPPICGLNLPHHTQAPLPLLLCPHTPMPGNVLKVCSFCDQFCLWKMSSLSWTQISQILPQSVRPLVLGHTEGLQIFQGCEGGHVSLLFSVPDSSSLSCLHSDCTQDQQHDMHRVEWNSSILLYFYECSLKLH